MDLQLHLSNTKQLAPSHTGRQLLKPFILSKVHVFPEVVFIEPRPVNRSRSWPVHRPIRSIGSPTSTDPFSNLCLFSVTLRPRTPSKRSRRKFGQVKPPLFEPTYIYIFSNGKGSSVLIGTLDCAITLKEGKNSGCLSSIFVRFSSSDGKIDLRYINLLHMLKLQLPRLLSEGS